MKILVTQTLSPKDILSRIASTRLQTEQRTDVVRPILNEVRQRGDTAVREYTARFDGWDGNQLRVTDAELRDAYELLEPSVLQAIKEAIQNIETFHKGILIKKELPIETQPGVSIWREFRSIERVGLYVPGGKAAYPSTVLMLAIPARVAGVQSIAMCTPASKEGTCNPAVLVAADLCGVKEIYKVGGAQAIGAMAYGTESIKKVYKIFGPGNSFVTTAKILVYGEVDIDMPAGPSEVAVLAEDAANPEWIAADLLSQLEHGEDSQAVLICFSESFARSVVSAMEKQMETLSRASIIRESFAKSFAVVAKDIEEACLMLNEYAPEHLEIVLSSGEEAALAKIQNAGSIFLGPYSSEPLGDYAAGSNHTLPTSGYAKMFSALSTDSFGKRMQVQRVSKEGITKLRGTVTTLARCEGLDAHAASIDIRFK